MHGDIQAVFDAEPPQTLLDEIEEEDELDDDILEVGIMRNRSVSPGIIDRARRRRWSSVVANDD